MADNKVLHWEWRSTVTTDAYGRRRACVEGVMDDGGIRDAREAAMTTIRQADLRPLSTAVLERVATIIRAGSEEDALNAIL